MGTVAKIRPGRSLSVQLARPDPQGTALQAIAEMTASAINIAGCSRALKVVRSQPSDFPFASMSFASTIVIKLLSFFMAGLDCDRRGSTDALTARPRTHRGSPRMRQHSGPPVVAGRTVVVAPVGIAAARLGDQSC